MDISKHIATVREGVDNALSFADDATKEVASRVVSAAEPTLRLALIDAVGEAVQEINDDLPSARVAVDLQDGDPTFVVQQTPFVPAIEEFQSAEQEADDADEVEYDEADETLVRFSLRLPKWAKDKVDDRAERRGLSTNAYLTEVIIAEIAGGNRGGRDRFGGPFGPGGPGPFGPGGRRGPKGWGPGGLIDPETASHIANVISEVFGQDPRRGGPQQRPGRRGDED